VRTIFLLDIDCFFASVEMALRPELRGKPLCVGGRRTDRGIVSCPNYEARAYGVRTAMPLRTAARLLPPDAVFLPGNHRLYGEYSRRVMNILERFTPDVEQVSVDEAYMDVTGCLHFWDHDPLRMAEAMQRSIRMECGLGVSIGAASTKLCAKIAAGVRKPDGIAVVPPGEERAFLEPLPAGVVPGVGPKTLPRLEAAGIRTVRDLLERPRYAGDHLLQALQDAVAGRGPRVAHEHRTEKSISRDTTFHRDTLDEEFMTAALYGLTEDCCKSLRRHGLAAGTVAAKVRFADFTTVRKQTTLPLPAVHEEELFPVVLRLFRSLLVSGRPVRLVGVHADHLVPVAAVPRPLDAGPAEKLNRLHARLDALQEKFGDERVKWGWMTERQ
jgi:DNA polymerase-4